MIKYQNIIVAIIATAVIISGVRLYNLYIENAAIREHQIEMLIKNSKNQEIIIEGNAKISKALSDDLKSIRERQAKNTEAINMMIASGKYENNCIDPEMLKALNERAKQ